MWITGQEAFRQQKILCENFSKDHQSSCIYIIPFIPKSPAVPLSVYLQFTYHITGIYLSFFASNTILGFFKGKTIFTNEMNRGVLRPEEYNSPSWNLSKVLVNTLLLCPKQQIHKFTAALRIQKQQKRFKQKNVKAGKTVSFYFRYLSGI